MPVSGKKSGHFAFYIKESRRIFFAFYKPFPGGDLFFSNLEWNGPKFSTLGRCRFFVWKRRGNMQFSTPEKAAARGRAGSKLPQPRCARQIPLFVTCGDIFPRPGEVFLIEGGSGEKENFAALPRAPSLRELSPQATEGVIKKAPAVLNAAGAFWFTDMSRCSRC